MNSAGLRHAACFLVPSLLAAAAAAAAEIVIGQVAPFSGPLAPTGDHMRAGAEIYFSQVNAAGGVQGANLKLVSMDDGYKAPETVRLARELIKESKPVALFGVVGTGNVEALVKENVLSQAGVPLVAIRSGASSLIKPVVPHVFLTRAGYAREIDAVVRQFVSTGATRIAVFYQDDPFGKDGLASAEAAIKAAGATLAAKAGYERNTTKVEAAVKAIGDVQPQGVLMVSNTAASAEFIKQSRAAGLITQYMALSVTDGPQVARTIGNQTAHGLGIVQIVPDPNNRSVPVVREMQDSFKKYAPKGIEINHTLLEGYVGAKVLVEGLRRAGAAPSPAKLRDALESIRNWDAGGIMISFSPDSHAGSSYVDISILDKEGRLLR
jgi:ABC-type branched-subunit amino acid transport system substrate-binding protein